MIIELAMISPKSDALNHRAIVKIRGLSLNPGKLASITVLNLRIIILKLNYFHIIDLTIKR